MSKTKEIILKIGHLPPLSKAAERALSALRDPNVAVQEIVEILKYDPPMTANILKHCNSAVYGVGRTIQSLQQAVVFIGLKSLRKLILTATVEKYFPQQGGYELNRLELWRHCLAVALIAEDLAPRVGAIQPDEAFTAGLLHDIGKVVTTHFLGGEHERIQKEADLAEKDFPTIEKEVFGMDHMEAGALILEKWGFSSEYCDVARHHHDPSSVPGHALTRLVHIADVAAILAGWNTGLDALQYHARPDVFKEAGLTFQQFQMEMSRMADKIAALEKEHYHQGE